jgi:hypothetical protein
MALAVLIVAGCGSKGGKQPWTAGQVVRVLMTNTMSLQGNHSPLLRHDPELSPSLPWKIHVDMCASMQGFVNPKESDYKHLLERLHQELAGIQFEGSGEGGPAGNTPRVPADFLKPEFYGRTGVNYSNLFSQFLSETNFNHAWLTDGVLCQNGYGVQASLLTEPLRRLLSEGGEFMLLALRSPYDGEYTSVRRVKESPADTPPKELTVTLTNAARPFLLWLFARPNQSLETVLSTISASIDPEQAAPPETNQISKIASDQNGQTPKVALLQNEPAAKPSPHWVVLLSRSRPQHTMTVAEFELTPKGPGRRVFGSLEPLDDGSELAPVWLAKVYGKKPLPFNFDVPVPMVKTDETNEVDRMETTWKATQNKLGVSLAAWSILTTNVPVGKTMTRQVVLERLRLDPMKPEFKLGANAHLEGDYVKLRLVMPVTRPASTTTYQAWMLTLTAPPSPEQESKWAQFSTEDDSSPSAGGCIYNLKSVLEDIHRECLVFDRKVFLTYWP